MSSDSKGSPDARPPAREGLARQQDAQARKQEPQSHRQKAQARKPETQPHKPETQPRERSKRKASHAQRGPRKGVQETSAGGVVIRGETGREQVVVIVPARRGSSGARVLGLPKGHIDPGENALQAATREVREEAGVTAKHMHDLGEVRYWYRRHGRTIAKSVVFFLFGYVSGETADHDDEVEQARWIDLRQALTELSYEGERGMIARALALLE